MSGGYPYGNNMEGSPRRRDGRDDRFQERLKSDESYELKTYNNEEGYAASSPKNGSKTRLDSPTGLMSRTDSRSGSGKDILPPSSSKNERLNNQFRALFFKTVSYQKRQWFVNICCVALCPFLMIAICVLLALIINNILADLTKPSKILQCSAAPAVDAKGFPLPTNLLPSAPILTGVANLLPLNSPANLVTEMNAVELNVNAQSALTKNVLHANTYTISGNSPINGNLQRTIQFGTDKLCVYWFGTTYPFSSPYANDPKITQKFFGLDSTFRPDPPGGWLSRLNDSDYVVNLLREQFYVWYNYSSVGMTGNVQNLGFKDPGNPIKYEDNPQINAANLPVGTGLFSQLDLNFYLSNETTETSGPQFFVRQVPFINQINANSDQVQQNLIFNIQSILSGLKAVNKDVLFQLSPSKIDAILFIINVNRVLMNLPYGVVYFQNMDTTTKKFKYTLQTGSDRRIKKMQVFPTEGLRRIIQQSELSNIIFKAINPTSTMKIVPGLRVMPKLTFTKIDIPLSSIIGSILFPFGVSFLLPIFVLILVKEKEDRITIMMKMNGMSQVVYYGVHFLHFFVMYMLNAGIFILAGVIFRLDFFVNTQFALYLSIFVVWGLVMIVLSFFLSVFFDTTRQALLSTFLMVLVGVILNIAATNIFTVSAPLIYFFWPPLAFYRALTILNISSFSQDATVFSFGTLVATKNDVYTALLAMLAEIFVFGLLTAYLMQVWPSKYGVRKPWYFPFTFWMSEGPPRKFSGKRDQNSSSMQLEMEDRGDLKEDKYVKMERRRVAEARYPPDCPVIIDNVEKRYPNGKQAVKNVSFAIEKGTVFGLLGSNGAGKTSLISVLTGVYPMTAGTAYLAGLDITQRMDDIYKVVGVCPQHDILWDDLTVLEHMLFYARLKGIPQEQERYSVNESLKKVALNSFENRLSKGLSGGEKRRLSIAIAMLNNPEVVFLDEPTTGLDPEVRRFIWNIINDAKSGTTIILTTHSMEEAEVLCSKIGIMAMGSLRCLGPQVLLKQVYGSGFKLSISCRKREFLVATEYIESLLPGNWRKFDNFSSTISYEFDPEPGTISKLFAEIERNKYKHGIQEWGLSQTSLDEVFLNIIQESDAEAYAE